MNSIKLEYNSPYTAKRASLLALITTEGFLDFCDKSLRLGKVTQQYRKIPNNINIKTIDRLNISLLRKIIFIAYISIFSASSARS